ncbi:MAG: hypothetical protein U5R06_12770 [candidate division KSB1 bacterium]|nr:hypothetical protein [candidate division KSB1 bacterium]
MLNITMAIFLSHALSAHENSTESESIGLSQVSEQGLQDEIMLHPLDANTAYTLKKGEWIYAQSPTNFPVPSWAWVGLTDWLTAEIDFLPLLGGLIVEPHLPIPSLNFRFKILEKNHLIPAVCFETMFQYFYKELNVNEEKDGKVDLIRKGTSSVNQFHLSWNPLANCYIHASTGFIYSHSIHIQSKTTQKRKTLFR